MFISTDDPRAVAAVAAVVVRVRQQRCELAVEIDSDLADRGIAR
ncbi:hypothetical protein [Frankia sp. Mgl5]|nr:hypothetical protein [Frankia sp. Mgl5]